MTTTKIPPKEYLCTIASRRDLTPTVFEMGFTTDQPLEFHAGQFISIVIPGAGPGGRDLRRAYSIASAPHLRPVELCVKLVEGGPGTGFLHKLAIGSQFKGFAPYGDFTFKPKPGRHACFVSTGTGIAPFRSMIQSLPFRDAPPTSVTCFFGVREESEMLYMDEIGRDSLVRWVATASRPTPAWSGLRGRVTDQLRALSDTIAWQDTEFYLCGNGAMIDEIKGILASKGIAKDSIHQEVYYRPPKEAGSAA